MKHCPDCLSEIPDAAAFCRFCGERVEGKGCAQCGVRNAPDAQVCRWCGHRYGGNRQRLQHFEPFEVTASLLPTFLKRARLLPQIIQVTAEKLVISTPGLLNLTHQEEEIPWNKVAGFDYKSGLVWDEITIETRGQSASKVPCLAKPDGERLRQVLQALET